MAGYSKMYLIGGEGGFQGSDGINPIQLQIWVGNADRQWLEPHYCDASISPLGALRIIVPAEPDSADAVLDACIAFFPSHFKDCPSLAIVTSELNGRERLDFDLGAAGTPKSWPQLREEARGEFNKLSIYEAEFKPYAAPKA